MANNIIKETEEHMKKAIESFEKELSRVRTGRATPTLLDGIKVDYYGSVMPISQLATVAVPEARQLTITPWDVNAITAIEKAILRSELGLTPSNDGKIIRVNVPALTEQRRKELVKVIKKMSEDAKVVVRNIRRDNIEVLKKQKKDKAISEDEMFKLQDDVQKLTDNFVKQLSDIAEKKEKEILEF